MALVDFYPSMQPSAVEVQNGKFFTLPIRLTKITQILSVLTHFTRIRGEPGPGELLVAKEAFQRLPRQPELCTLDACLGRAIAIPRFVCVCNLSCQLGGELVATADQLVSKKRVCLEQERESAWRLEDGIVRYPCQQRARRDIHWTAEHFHNGSIKGDQGEGASSLRGDKAVL